MQQMYFIGHKPKLLLRFTISQRNDYYLSFDFTLVEDVEEILGRKVTY